jgi:hypothetical protein
MTTRSTHPRTGHVLTATAGMTLFAVPTAATTVIASRPCSPPPPWAEGWLHGMALWLERTLWVLDLGGVRRPVGGSRPDQPMIVVGGEGPAAGRSAWALAIDAPGVIAEATPVAGGIPATLRCPADWLRACLLGDGRRALLVDVQAIGRFLAAPVGAPA